MAGPKCHREEDALKFQRIFIKEKLIDQFHYKFGTPLRLRYTQFHVEQFEARL